MRDQLCHLQLYLDGEFQEMLQERVRSRKQVPLSTLPAYPNRELSVYLQGVARAGMEAIAVDVTTTDVRAAGFHTARVIVPWCLLQCPGSLPSFGRQPVAGGRPEYRRRQSVPAATPLRVRYGAARNMDWSELAVHVMGSTGILNPEPRVPPRDQQHEAGPSAPGHR